MYNYHLLNAHVFQVTETTENTFKVGFLTTFQVSRTRLIDKKRIYSKLTEYDTKICIKKR